LRDVDQRRVGLGRDRGAVGVVADRSGAGVLRLRGGFVVGYCSACRAGRGLATPRSARFDAAARRALRLASGAATLMGGSWDGSAAVSARAGRELANAPSATVIATALAASRNSFLEMMTDRPCQPIATVSLAAPAFGLALTIPRRPTQNHSKSSLML
jgi:hypothetical protein